MIQVNDHVRFKGGGPDMVVTGFEGQKLRCQWNSDGAPLSSVFHAETLELLAWDGREWSSTLQESEGTVPPTSREKYENWNS